MISKPLSIALSGGKGGTGTSVLARNLGMFFAQIGNRVVLLDFSDKFSSLNCLSGVQGWKMGQSEGIFHQKTEVENFLMLHAPQAPESLVSVHQFEKEEKRFDVMISDLPQDLKKQLLDIFIFADIPLAVVTPEPESIFETYEFICRTVFALIERESEGKWSYASLSQDLPMEEKISYFLSPQDVLLFSGDEDLKIFLKKMLSEILIGIVVNEASTSHEFEIGTEIENFARKVFSLPVVYVGAVEFDEEARESGKEKKPFIISHPDSKAAVDVKKLGRRFVSCPGIKLIKPSWKLGIGGDENLYELLQVSFASPGYEIKNSYHNLKKIFSKQSVFGGFINRQEVLNKLESYLDEAFATLDDRSGRADYDKALSSDLKIDIDESDEAAIEEEVEWVVKVGSGKGMDKKITGRFIRETREKMGLNFRDIASATKIGTHYLRAIEEENYVDLPEPLYVKGFLKEIARILNLDPDKVALSYLKRMKEGSREK